MEAKELMLNNWIQFEHNGSIKQRQVAELSLEESNKFKPIPLTEEWLLKFGFESDWSGWSHKDVYFELGVSGDKYINMVNGGEYNHGVPFEHVHQLQNLFFALTGEELTIKES